MNAREKNKILVDFARLRPLYDRLATELHRVLDGDARFAEYGVYAVKHRIKSDARLVEKIDSYNRDHPRRCITPATFQSRVKDLLGVRIVVLRLDDLKLVRDYIAALVAERRLRLVGKPKEMRTFLIRPGRDAQDEYADMQYSGYSSIHYNVKAGAALGLARDVAALKAELQLRTIFEEAWGEIDHKYRYELKRSGTPIPQNIDDGFRDLALYLQATTRQADHLCEQAQELIKPPRKRQPSPRKRRARSPGGTPPVVRPVTLEAMLHEKVGFTPTSRTMMYIERRLAEHSISRGRDWGPDELGRALSDDVIARYKRIYQEVLSKEAFSSKDANELDLDTVPLVNFALFSSNQRQETAEAGLRASLRTRP